MKATTHQWPFWKRVLCLTRSSILIGFQSWRLKTWRHLCGFWDREGTLHQAEDPRWNESALPFIVLFPLRLYHNKAPYALRHVLEEGRRDYKVQNSNDSKLNGVQRLWMTWRHRTQNLSASWLREEAFLFLLICYFYWDSQMWSCGCICVSFERLSLDRASIYEHLPAFSSSLS